VVFDSRNGRDEGADYSRWNDVYLTLRGQYGARSTREDPEDSTSSVLHVAAPVWHQGRIAGVLTVSKPQRSMASFMEKTRQRIIFLGAVAALAAIGLGLLVATWLTQPIQRLTRYAKALRDGNRVPLPRLGGSEMAALGRTIEDLRDALEGRAYVENYVQALTHEIKSPVAAIRGAAELLHEPMAEDQRDRFLGNIRDETIRIQEIVDRLLLLSAVEAKKGLDERRPVDLEATLFLAWDGLRAPAEAKGIRFTADTPPGPDRVTVSGDPFLLEKALGNLLQNAVAFSPRGGRVRARIRTRTREGAAEAEVEVRDDGPGIPDFALPRLFERFFSLPRPDTGKKSSGLGLAFVREVAALHGGSVTVENAGDGEPGAVATLRLPVEPDA
jgi:two-component system sensor histidine kinase CreC